MFDCLYLHKATQTLTRRTSLGPTL